MTFLARTARSARTGICELVLQTLHIVWSVCVCWAWSHKPCRHSWTS